jgi:hypothetical protein
MGHAIPKQHPAVVLRSHYNLVRALLGVAMIGLVGLAIALVVVADDNDESANTSAIEAAPVMPRLAPAPLPAYPTPAPEAVSPGSDRSYSGPAPTRKLDGATDTAPIAPLAPGTRYDGGPEEGSRGAIAEPVAPGTRYDGGPEEGTRGGIAEPVAPSQGGIDESRSGPGFRTD